MQSESNCRSFSPSRSLCPSRQFPLLLSLPFGWPSSCVPPPSHLALSCQAFKVKSREMKRCTSSGCIILFSILSMHNTIPVDRGGQAGGVKCSARQKTQHLLSLKTLQNELCHSGCKQQPITSGCKAKLVCHHGDKSHRRTHDRNSPARSETLSRQAAVMGFEATLRYSYANNLEQCVTLFTGSAERSTSNPPLFSLLGSTADITKTNRTK